MPKAAAEFDIIIYGASGYTGRLVAEYLCAEYPGKSGPRWAMAGRSLDKLAEVRDLIGAPAATPLVEADADDPASVRAMCKRTKVVLTTVGPYQLYGSDLVAACAETGTDYVDLCGEPAWMRQMIDAHDATAKASGARIVFSCGFDSIPFDLGVYRLQAICRERFGKPSPRIKGRVSKMQGKFSGGTAASLTATMAAAAKDPRVLELLKTPFALTPGFEGAAQPSGMKPQIDEAVGGWVAPFVMAPINTRNVHRTNFLTGQSYGTDFVYDEMMITGPGEGGEAMAKAIAGANPFGDNPPKPGEGPTKEERDTGYRDPGYGSTSKMIAESALCLVHECADGAGGITTPGAVLGGALIDRLEAHAGLTFAPAD
jgi:short subunit dehydrogenase-like uncharacterized protein